MSLAFFLLRLLTLPLLLAFFLIGTVVYIIIIGLAWVLIGDVITIYVKYPDWRPL